MCSSKYSNWRGTNVLVLVGKHVNQTKWVEKRKEWEDGTSEEQGQPKWATGKSNSS